MGDVRDLLPQRQIGHPFTIQGSWYAYFAKNAIVNQPAQVIIPDISTDTEWTCFWAPRVKIVSGDLTMLLPLKGDAALINFDNRRVPWVAVWWPL